MMHNKLLLLTAAFLCLCGVCNGRFTYTQKEEEEDTIHISPTCAAVLITAGASAGGALAYTLSPAAVLCKAGFCSAGVSSSSFASWWQSTMPLVKAGSIFATLQSIAMGGVSAKVVVAGSALGGGLSMQYLPFLCAYVDDPDSKMAP